MKIKVIKMPYDKVMATKNKKLGKAKRPNMFFRVLLKILCSFDLISTRFKMKKIGMEKLGKNEPCLYLMNHCSFLDLKICMNKLFPRPINIVTTSDGFVSRNWLMRQIGCISTKKFTVDPKIVKEILYAVNTLNNSILMYPEAGYSFDGTQTTMMDNLGKLAKLLKIPVVTIMSKGSYLRQPLYNNLHIRKLKTEATMEYILSKKDIEEKDEKELNDIIKAKFDYDDFKYQQETNMLIKDKNRAEGINRILYKCPHCFNEGDLVGEGITLTCPRCNKKYELTENGFMKAVEGNTEINHIPSWYKWEREEVKKEILNGTYCFEDDVQILMMKDTYNIYDIGEGHLTHNIDGFKLVSKDHKLEFSLDPLACYSVNSDFFWYQIGDMVSIGDHKGLFYCFPKKKKDVVAKIRLATEEIYKLKKDTF